MHAHDGDTYFDPAATVEIACRTNVKFKALLEQGMGVVRVLVIRSYTTFASCSQVSEIYSCDRPTSSVSCTSTLCSERTGNNQTILLSPLCTHTHNTLTHTHMHTSPRELCFSRTRHELPDNVDTLVRCANGGTRCWRGPLRGA